MFWQLKSVGLWKASKSFDMTVFVWILVWILPRIWQYYHIWQITYFKSSPTLITIGLHRILVKSIFQQQSMPLSVHAGMICSLYHKEYFIVLIQFLYYQVLCLWSSPLTLCISMIWSSERSGWRTRDQQVSCSEWSTGTSTITSPTCLLAPGNQETARLYLLIYPKHQILKVRIFFPIKYQWLLFQ